MQITSFSAQNFKSIEKFDFALRKVNVFTGPNGAGKTTVLHALRYAITGKAPTDIKRNGTSSGYVSADITDVGVVKRTFAKETKVTVNDKNTTGKSVAESLNGAYSISPDTSNVLTSGELLTGMSSGDLSAFLINEGFLKLDVDIEKVVKYCKPSPEGESELRMYFPEAPEVIPVDELKSAYAYYFEARKTLSKETDTLRVKAAYTGIKPPNSVKDIIVLRDSVSEKLGKLKSESESYRTMKATFDRQTADIKALQAKADAITATKPSPKGVADVKKSLEDSLREITESERTISVLKNTVEQMTKLIEQLNKPICPISEKLVCTTDKTVVSDEVLTGLENARSELETLQAKLFSLKGAKEALEAKSKQLNDDAIAYQKRIDYLAQAEQLGKSLIKLPKQPVEKGAEELQFQLKTLNEEYDLAVKYDAASKAAGELEKLDKKLEVYQELVDALSPKNGIRQKILESRAAQLEDHCNDRLSFILPAYKLKFDMSDGMKIMLEDADGNVISYESVSRGEQLRVRFIMLDLINALSGFRLLMLDDLDTLDVESLSALLDLLKDEEILKGYDHIFLCGIDHPDTADKLKDFCDEVSDSQIIKMNSKISA
jgi:DNA repair exonuclease SbcCD ATPase subunit